MWIKADDSINLKRIAPVFEDAPFEEPVTFNENNTAQVEQETGEYLVNVYERITEKQSETNE